MKRIYSRVLIAVVAFLIGVMAAAVRNRLYPRPAVISSKSAPVKREVNGTAWQTLLQFKDQNLRTLKEQEIAVLRQAINSLTGSSENKFLVPQLFSNVTNSDGESRYVLVQESPLVFIPGSSGLRIDVFTLEGKLLNSSEFDSGWRISLESMEFKQINGLRGDVLEVKSLPFINGQNIGRQYYSLVDERLLLIRLEDTEGQLIRNYYTAPNHTIGLTHLGWSMNEWEGKLNSNDVAEVLAALTWIGGDHLSPEAGDPGYVHEEMADARMAADLKASETVKTIVKGLMKSDHAWIRKAAKLTAESSVDK